MRKIININKGWNFVKKDLIVAKVLNEKATKVDLPHTWNNLDGQDGGSDYYRGTCWYYKKLGKIKHTTDEVVYLEFNGVNAESDVYFNGVKVAHHEGGYQTFRARIDHLLDNNNVLAVRVDNSPNDYIYPSFADFTFYGGIYRDVNIIITNKAHFDLDYYGGPGVTVTPKVVKENARVTVECFINDYKKQVIEANILDREGNVVASTQEKKLKFALTIENVHLWNGRIDPYLYTLDISIKDGDKILDNKEIKFGCRTFKVDPNKGFFLNGKPYPLHGVSRHQDRENMGWAITRKEHKEDMDLICEVGANTIRLAHYQHDQYFYDLCDERGMVVWAEIPFISNVQPNGFGNAQQQMKELITQNYNHPSIVCWGLSNEISMAGVTEELIRQHNVLNDLCHEMDKTRITTMAQLSMLETDSPMNHISDIISYNHYFGWYGGEAEYNAVWLDKFHKENPKICFGLSEYGCEAILKWHNSHPEMGDYSEEYQSHYHHVMLETFRTRPYLWATHVWNMFDFGSDMRDEGGVKGRNHKGLVTYDRKIKKDSFYLYKAYWTNEPMVHITSKRYINRCEDETKVIVYSNLNEVSLYVDGNLFETKPCDKVVEFTVPLNKSIKLLAVAGDVKDTSFIKKVKKEDLSYMLEGKTESVVNWFDKEGNSVSLTFNPGYFSIKDKIKTIQADENASKVLKAFMDKMMVELDKMGISIPAGMIKMMGGFTIERLAKMAGERLPQEMVAKINSELQQCKK